MVSVDHETIKKWIIKHKGKPEIIDDPDANGDEIGIRVDFPGPDDDRFFDANEIREIPWEEFFKIFEDQQLAFEYEAEVGYDPSLSYRFLKREMLKDEYSG